jgi:hypothetical protein
MVASLRQVERPQSPQVLRAASLGIALLGVLLRLRQYFANRSLWLDEAVLALNLVDRSFVGLTRPLDYGQGAPIGFLFIQKLLIRVLGNRDCVLRLLPLLAGIAAVFLMRQVAESALGRKAALVALGVFAISEPLVYYASEIKQYSSDALFSLLLLFVFSRFRQGEARLRHFIELGVVGVVAMWMSHPAVFTIAGLSMSLVLGSTVKKHRYRLTHLGGMLFLWAVNLAILVLVSLRHLTADTTLQDYWRHSFMPMPPWRNAKWLIDAFLDMFEHPIGLSVAPIGAGLFLIGCVSLSFRRWQLALVLVTQLLVTLLASGLMKYPFSGRLLLFLAPAVILLIAEGIERLRLLLHRHSPAASFGLWLGMAALVLYGPIGAAFENLRHPDMGEHIKPVMSYVSRNRLDADGIYVYSGAYPAFSYYLQQYGFDRDDYIKGILSREEPSRYISDVDKLIGFQRAWFVFSHNCDWCTVDEQAYILEHLEEVGMRLDEFQSSNASVYLYDLSGASSP